VSEVRIGSIPAGGSHPPVLIAGPDVIESRELLFEVCAAIRDIAAEFGLPFILKSSYAKANRSSGHSFAGPGLEAGLAVLAEASERFGVPVTTDVHETAEVAPVAAVADLVQIPAFLCRQTPLALAAAATQKAVNIKKGQFMAPAGMHALVAKITGAGNPNVLVTERGTSFGYNNLVVDMRGLHEMARTGTPVIFDLAHTTQLPGGAGDRSGGERRYAAVLARAAAGAGVAGFFAEVHPDPPAALCDADSQVTPAQLHDILAQVMAIDAARRATAGDEARALPTAGEDC